MTGAAALFVKPLINFAVVIRVGIFFGGASREREIAFAGGRTLFDNLDKNLFEAIPVFVDSLGNFIELHWPFIYKGTIRDFYPPVNFHPQSAHGFAVYAESLGELSSRELDEMAAAVGRRVTLQELKHRIDFAFLSLHGAYGEDGTIQGLLEWFGIPYSGSGILPSAIGMNKSFQKRWMKAAGWTAAGSFVIRRNEWMASNESPEKIHKKFYKQSLRKPGLPFVIRPANQGSSIGVSIQKKKKAEDFVAAVNQAFFIRRITHAGWNSMNEAGQADFVRMISEIKDGTGIPFLVHEPGISPAGLPLVYHPEVLLERLTRHFRESKEPLLLESVMGEQEVLIEEFIDGIEFSCIVIRAGTDRVLALPPTEIRKDGSVYDYRSKYLAGMSRKVTPIELPAKDIRRIRKACEQLFEFFGFHVYARIDGFVRKRDGKIFLNDPNTTSGMLPSSFFFHQAAEIGLNPSQFLTYIIRTSLEERITSLSVNAGYRTVLERLDQSMDNQKQVSTRKIRVAVILGGYSTERHISVESGRNVFEKLASSVKYEAIPVFLTGDPTGYELYQIPVNLLLKDNADDIRDKIMHFKKHPEVERIRKEASELTRRYASKTAVLEPVRLTLAELKSGTDAVFIALHGRPGEDGRLQQDLEVLGIPYNGSGVETSALTIDKFETNERLQRHGFTIARHLLLTKTDWKADPEKFYDRIESQIPYPFICKPVDDGCSSAVKKIKDRSSLNAYCHLVFRESEKKPDVYGSVIHLKPREEFPRKETLLVEELIGPNGAARFLEITGGMFTSLNGNGQLHFEVFEPSEALASEDVLSLEEKFLAGEGQNITPARFSADPDEYRRIAAVVKGDLERAARVLGVEGYCRIDAFVRIFENGKVETVIIEINSLPGLTPATCIFHQAALSHLKPFDLIDRILEFGFQKHRNIGAK